MATATCSANCQVITISIQYDNGEGLTQDHVEAVIWYRKAAEQGLAMAQFNLGQAYYNGDGVVQNHVEAMKWYRKAADQGDALSQTRLGMAYVKGGCMPRDDKQAVEWFLKAADQGNSIAQACLGAAYAEGLGVKKDLIEAYKWLDLSCSNTENKSSVKYRDSLRKRLSRKEIAEGKRRAFEFSTRTRDQIQESFTMR